MHDDTEHNSEPYFPWFCNFCYRYDRFFFLLCPYPLANYRQTACPSPFACLRVAALPTAKSRRKVFNQQLPLHKIVDVNLYNYNPDTLAETYKKFGKNEWYFFTSRQRKYPNGTRPDRSAGDGYWKATGADRAVKKSNGLILGYKKSLVFYRGKPPRGHKTNWIMHEYRVQTPPFRNRLGAKDMMLDECVLCRIYKKHDKSSKTHSCHEDDNGEGGEDDNEVDENDPKTEDFNSDALDHSTNFMDNNNYNLLFSNPQVTNVPLGYYDHHLHVNYNHRIIHTKMEPNHNDHLHLVNYNHGIMHTKMVDPKAPLMVESVNNAFKSNYLRMETKPTRGMLQEDFWGGLPNLDNDLDFTSDPDFTIDIPNNADSSDPSESSS